MLVTRDRLAYMGASVGQGLGHRPAEITCERRMRAKYDGTDVDT